MGFLDRTWKIATGVGGAIQAPFGLVKDFATAPWDDDEDFNGFWHALQSRTTERGSQLLGNLFGPTEGLGAVVGGLPETGVRDPLRPVVGGFTAGTEWVFREGISEPLSTLMTMGSLADSKLYGEGWGAFADPDSWRLAYKIAQDRSPGQAIALSLTHDILDDDEVQKMMGTDLFKISSGLSDAVIRWKLDPTVLFGAGTKAARYKYVDYFDETKQATRLARQGVEDAEIASIIGRKHSAHVDTYMKSRRWARVDSDIDSIVKNAGSVEEATGAIKAKYPTWFHDDTVASLLATAKDSAQRAEVVRFGLGDLGAAGRMAERNSALSSRMSRLIDERALIKTELEDPTWSRSSVYRRQQRMNDIDAEIKEIYSEAGLNVDRLERAEGSISSAPRVSVQSRVRARYRNSEFVQSSPVFKPVRRFVDMTPQRIITVGESGGDIQLDRMLRDAKLDTARRDYWRGRYVAADPTGRMAIIQEAEEEGFRHLARQYGLTSEQAEEVLKGARQQRAKTINLIKESKYDGAGRTLIQGEDNGELFEYPILSTQTGQMVPTVDFWEIEKHLKPLNRLKNRYGIEAVQAGASSTLGSLMRVWRPAMLLRPAWPIRVVGDEQLRVAAKMGALLQNNKALKKAVKDYAGWKKSTRSFAAKMANETNLWWAGGTGAVFGTIVGGPVAGALFAGLGAGGAKYFRTLDEIPYGQVTINGIRAAGAFGNTTDEVEHIKQLVSSSDSLDQFVGAAESDAYRRMVERPDLWRTFSYGDGRDTYGKKWGDIVNGQIAPDPLAQIILRGDHPEPGLQPPPPPGYQPPPKRPGGRGPRTPPFVPELPSARTAEETTASLVAMADEGGGKFYTDAFHQVINDQTTGDNLATLAYNNREYAESVAHVPPDNVVVPNVEISKTALRKVAKNPYKEGVPLLIKVDNMYYVADGVDKYVAAYNRGMPIQAHVVDLSKIDGVGDDLVHAARSELESAVDTAKRSGLAVRDYPASPYGQLQANTAPLKNPYPARTTVAAAPPPGWTGNPVDLPPDFLPGADPTRNWMDKTDVSTMAAQGEPALYHATVDLPGVMEQGLRSGADLGTTALAGTPGVVSITYDPYHAAGIAENLQMSIRAARGEMGYDEIFDWFNSRNNGLLEQVAQHGFLNGLGLDSNAIERITGDPFWTPHTMKELGEVYKLAKESGAGVYSPYELIQHLDQNVSSWTDQVWGPTVRPTQVGIYTDEATMAAMDPDKVGIVKVAVPKQPTDVQMVPSEFEFRLSPEEVMVLSGGDAPFQSVLRLGVGKASPLTVVDRVANEYARNYYGATAIPTIAYGDALLPDIQDVWPLGTSSQIDNLQSEALKTIEPTPVNMRNQHFIFYEDRIPTHAIKEHINRVTSGQGTDKYLLPYGFQLDDGRIVIVKNGDWVPAARAMDSEWSNMVLDQSLLDRFDPETINRIDDYIDEWQGIGNQNGVDTVGFPDVDLGGEPVFAGAGPGGTVPPPPAGGPPGGGGFSGGQPPIQWDGRTSAKWWLTHTKEGMDYGRAMPARAIDPEQWVDTLADIIDDLTKKDSNIARKLLATDDAPVLEDLENAVRKSRVATGGGGTEILDEPFHPDEFPLVHGQEAIQLVGGNQVWQLIQRGLDKGMHVLGGVPTDTLSRNPFFAKIYRVEMERRLSQYTAETISQSKLLNFERAARDTALFETRKLLYDLAERSQFGQMMRNILPFYPAWQEVLTRWSGLLIENPEFAAHAAQVLKAPNKAGVVYKDPETGEEYVTFRIPAFARAIVGHGLLSSALDSQGNIRFDKNGFNMVSQGLPGFGPFVQTALKPFVDAHPELEESLKVVFPFGVPENYTEPWLPTTARRAQAALGDGRSYRNAYNRILLTHLVKMQTGEEEQLDLNDPEVRSQFLSDVQNEAGQFASFRLIAGSILPTAPIYDSPYEPMIQAYRQKQQEDPEGADDWFLDTYGEEYFALTQSFTKLADGVNPSIQGYQARKKYENLIEAHPELGSLIIGNEGGGEAVKFSAAIYGKQLRTPVRPGSPTKQRTPLSGEQLVEQPDVRLGWTKFSRTMDMIEAMQFERGLPNLQVKAAQDLRLLKQAVIASLAGKYPAWFAEYSQTDELKWQKRISGMEEIVADSRLSQRPDIEALGKYLRFRSVVVSLLQAREQTGISAAANQDLRVLYETVVSKMKEGSLAFSDLYNRWLDNDPLQPAGEAA